MIKQASLFLVINTSVPKKIQIKLLKREKRITRNFIFDKLDEKLLPAIIKTLRDSGLHFENLSACGVVNDAGSFMTQRVTLATINTLAWVAKVRAFAIRSVDFKKLDYAGCLRIINVSKIGIIKPQYSMPPQITKSKKLYDFINS